jgi:integrase
MLEVTRYALATGLPDTPANRVIASHQAHVIEYDIATGDFDPTLAKYKQDITKPLKPENITAVELMRRYTDEHTRNLQKSTRYKYNGCIEALRQYFGDKPAKQIKLFDVEKFIQ